MGALAATLLGFSVMAALNAIGSLLQFGVRPGALGRRAAHLGFVGMHHALVAMILVLAFGPHLRWISPRLRPRTERALTPALAFTLGLAAFHFVLEEDLGAFTAPVAFGMTAMLALAFPFLILVAREVGHRLPGRLLLAAGGFATLPPNHVILMLNYPGFHVWLVVVAGVALSLALHRAPWPRLARLLSSRPSGLAFAFAGAGAVALSPSARVRVELANDDSASLHRFISAVTADVRRPRYSVVESGPREPVPAGPALIAREDMLVLLLTVDAFRWDVFRDHPETVPTMRLLADEGVSFTRAYAPSAETKGSLSSLFAGRHATGLCWKFVKFGNGRAPFPDTDPTPRVPELFTQGGFDTFTVPSTERLLPKYGIGGGFSRMVELRLVQEQQLSRNVFPHLYEWLGDPSAPGRFGYLHLMDAHGPHDSAQSSGPVVERYRAELTAVDRQIGKLIVTLKKRGLWERTILVITADHGEAFGEHHQKTHGGSVYEELTRVPLIVRVPGLPHREVDELVSGLDLGPTLLDLAGLETPGAYLGRSLVPLLRGESLPPRPAPIESLRGHRALVFPDGMKIIAHGAQGSIELYDLNADPGELENLADERADLEARYEALDAYFQRNETRGFGCRVKSLR